MFNPIKINVSFTPAATLEDFNAKSLSEKAACLSKSLFDDAHDASIRTFETAQKNRYRIQLVYEREEDGKEYEDRINLGKATKAKSQKQAYQEELLSNLFTSLYQNEVSQLRFMSNEIISREYGKMTAMRDVEATITKKEAKPEPEQAKPKSDKAGQVAQDLMKKALQSKKAKTETKKSDTNSSKATADSPSKPSAAPETKAAKSKTKATKAKAATPKKTTRKAKTQNKPTVKKAAESTKTSPETKSAATISDIIKNKDLSRKERNDKIKDAVIEQVLNTANGPEFQRFISFMSKFKDYSLNNIFLLFVQASQRDMDLSYVAGAKTWNSLGYSIKKGESALYIWAPMVKKTKDEDSLENPDDDEEEETKIYFKLVPVFDASQTTIDPKYIPSMCEELTGSVKDFEKVKPAMIKFANQTGVRVEFKDIDGGALGYFDRSDTSIAIQEGMSEKQTIKTLAHEIAHSINDRDPKEGKSKEVKEVIAEGSAYYFMALLGVDTSEYSTEYIAGFDSRDAAQLQENIGLIQKTANTIYDFVEKELGQDKKKAKAKAKLDAKKEQLTKEREDAQEEKRAAFLKEVEGFEKTPFKGGVIIINKAADRIQILFDKKPDNKTRTALKSHAWRYSPKNAGAWQRKITENAMNCAKEICKIA